jgi:hypothetical protein
MNNSHPASFDPEAMKQHVARTMGARYDTAPLPERRESRSPSLSGLRTT